MIKKVDYSLKFYKCNMINDNQETFNFYLAGRSFTDAESTVKNHINSHSDRYHIIPGENDIKHITLMEVSVEDYGKSYGYEVIN